MSLLLVLVLDEQLVEVLFEPLLALHVVLFVGGEAARGFVVVVAFDVHVRCASQVAECVAGRGVLSRHLAFAARRRRGHLFAGAATVATTGGGRCGRGRGRHRRLLYLVDDVSIGLHLDGELVAVDHVGNSQLLLLLQLLNGVQSVAAHCHCTCR